MPVASTYGPWVAETWGLLNTLHQVGPAAAVTVLAADVLKGTGAVLIASVAGEQPWAAFYAAIAVVAGHNWPIFLWFRGGKGAATVLGVSLAVLPWLTLIAVTPAVLVALVTRQAVVAAAIGFLLLNIITVVTGQDWEKTVLCLLLTFIVIATYLGHSWRETVSALRQRRWLALFSFE